MLDIEAPNVDAARMRRCGKGLLSLALIDTRNQTLRWTAALERAGASKASNTAHAAEHDPLAWTLGHVGWYQEFWIARNMQRQRGDRCEPSPSRLASILPDADRLYDPAQASRPARWRLDFPDLQSTHHYLVETLETTLELLDGTTDDDDDTLYFYRLALFHEDAHIEALAMQAQALGLDCGLLPALPARPGRLPLMFPATSWTLGSGSSGFAYDNECERHVVAVPEFEIDAQPVSWAQFGEFVEDGGYDQPAHWSEPGWAWAQREARRTPRHVDQMRRGVLQRRFGRLVRVPMAQPVMHVSWFEADAWCRWAGRRLPTEVEWEAAAGQGASRGFQWGDVWEWTASTFRPYPGFVPGPDRGHSTPCFGTHKAVRGASFATRAHLRSAKLRGFELPECDDLFVGFRSCAA